MGFKKKEEPFNCWTTSTNLIYVEFESPKEMSQGEAEKIVGKIIVQSFQV